MDKNRIGIVCFLLIVLAHTIYGCSSESERIYEKEIVKISQPVASPLEDALIMVGLNPSTMKRPEYFDAGYNMICRMPLIDNIANNPFYMHHWAEDISTRFQENAGNGLKGILSVSNEMVFLSQKENRYGLKNDNYQPDNKGLSNVYDYLCNIHGTPEFKSEIDKIQNAGFSKEFDNQLGVLIYTLSEASFLAHKAFSLLTEDERSFLISKPERFFFPNGVRFEFLTAPVFVQEKISFLTRKIDFSSLYHSADMVAQAVGRFIDYIEKQADPSDPSCYFKNGATHKDVALRISSPIGDIVILGQEKNITSGTAALLIDLGGDDIYTGDIANGTFMPGRISVVIDIDGNDIYDNKMNPFSQGFGCLSIGVLVDLNGNDRYISGNMSQGSGIFGVGMLEDVKGDDVYLMGMMGQGFGVFGTGILLDRNGNDRYMINGLGQGAGSTMGFGVLIDSSGNDKYIADSKKTRGNLVPDDLMNHVQGAGLSIRSPEWPKHLSLYGGIGFLNDGQGDDFYYSDGGNCMGSSYFMSLGALVDHEGNDIYMPEKGYGIGSAVHLTSAIFIDKKGNDQYFADTHTGGVGSDRSMGIMIDGEGDDIYGPSDDYLKKKIQKEMADKGISIAASELEKKINKSMADTSYGAALKPKALGMLIDFKGDDQYFSREGGYGESLGGVIPPVDPGDWSHAILLDLNGKDYYFKKGMKDNHYLKYFGHGLCYDTIYQGSDIFNNSDIDETTNFQVKNTHVEMELYTKAAAMLKPDFLFRYSAIGKIVEQGTDQILEIINLLKVSDDNDLNRDLLEILTIFIIKNQLEKSHQKHLENLLQAKDPFVRGFTAHTFGSYKARDSMEALTQSLGEENADVRSKIIWALGSMDDPGAWEVLMHTALNDPSIHCRREAVKALSQVEAKHKEEDFKNPKKIMKVIMKCAADIDSSIRAYAASGLKNYIEDLQAKRTLEELLADENVYVRRSAAKALIENGDKTAIPVLIETLKYPSIDTFEFYGHDLIKEIAFYCGVDFSKEKRYLYSTWAKWWKENGKKVDLEKNLSIKKEIKNAFFVKHESIGVEIFKRLLKENPDNIVIKKEYVRFCYEWIHYKLLTQERITSKIIEKCIRLQKNIIEMEPEVAEHWYKLAGFHARLSKYDEAADTMKSAVNMDPDNENYIKAWRQFKRLAGK